MTKVLVSGGAGAIGSLTVRELVEEGHRPVVFSRSPNPRFIHDLQGRFDIATGDIRDPERLQEVIQEQGVEAIVHLAVVVGPPSDRYPLMAVDINVRGTAAVLEAARNAGVKRVVCGGSKAVLGRMRCKHGYPRYVPVDETHPASPWHVYGTTKHAAEQLGKVYRDLWGLEVTTLRLANTWGPGRIPGWHSRYGGYLVEVVEAAMAGQPVDLGYHPDALDDYGYNGNTANALVQACFAPRLPRHVYHVGSGVGMRLREMVDKVRQVYPSLVVNPPSEKALQRTHEMLSCVLDIRRAQRDWGYHEKYGFEAAVRHCARLLEIAAAAPGD